MKNKERVNANALDTRSSTIVSSGFMVSPSMYELRQRVSFQRTPVAGGEEEGAVKTPYPPMGYGRRFQCGLER
jgi:hypothetical protein